MCATKTSDVEATVAQVEALSGAGAAIVRVAVDSRREAEALKEIRDPDGRESLRRPSGELPPGPGRSPLGPTRSATNPGHLYHHERERPWQDKVRFLVDVAARP